MDSPRFGREPWGAASGTRDDLLKKVTTLRALPF